MSPCLGVGDSGRKEGKTEKPKQKQSSRLVSLCGQRWFSKRGQARSFLSVLHNLLGNEGSFFFWEWHLPMYCLWFIQLHKCVCVSVCCVCVCLQSSFLPLAGRGLLLTRRGLSKEAEGMKSFFRAHASDSDSRYQGTIVKIVDQ